MEGGSTIREASNEQRSTLAPHAAKRLVAFEASNLTDDDVKGVEKHGGLSLVNRNDDGYTIFLVNDDHTAVEEMPVHGECDSEDDGEIEDEEVEEEDELSGDFKGKAEAEKNLSFKDKRVKDKFVSIYPKIEIAEIDMDVKVACDRDNTFVVKHYLKLGHTKIIHKDFEDEKTCRGHFVYSLVFFVEPTEEWKPKISRVKALPASDDQPVELNIQTGNSKTTTAGLNTQGTATTMLSTSKTTTKGSSSTPYRWEQAEVDETSRSIKWTCNLQHWKGPQVFNAEKPYKFNGEDLPEVHYKLPHLVLNDIPAWAEWETSQEHTMLSFLSTKKMKWNVTVQLYTVKLKKLNGNRFLKKLSCRKYGYEFEKLGPGTLPPIKKEIEGE